MAISRSVTLWKVPRRMACRMTIPKKISTMFSQDPEVGVKCRVMRRSFASQAVTLGWVVSSRGESHSPALVEPYVTVSRHTAPTGRPWVGERSAQWAKSRG